MKDKAVDELSRLYSLVLTRPEDGLKTETFNIYKFNK